MKETGKECEREEGERKRAKKDSNHLRMFTFGVSK